MSKTKSLLDTNERDTAVAAAGQKMVKRGICRVCDQICSSYFYYGALCCEGCKQFFRRVVLQGDEPKYLCNSTCDLNKVKCRYCRFQKCLLVGMEPKFVKIKRAEKLEDDFINGLKQIERAFKKIWDSSQPLPEAYTNRHQTMAGLLQDKHNLLGNANQFPEEPVGWDKAQFIHDVETNGLFSMHELSVQSVKDWFIMVELAKTFPFIQELCLNDQICQLNHIYLPARLMMNSFYSHAINAKSTTRKNGLEIVAIVEAKQIRHDQRSKELARLYKLAHFQYKKLTLAGILFENPPKLCCLTCSVPKLGTLINECSCKLIEKMSEIDVNYDEFLLLLAIFMSNSNADGLSQIGRKKLYQESIHFSKALQKLLHCKFGLIGGSEKFASLMDVMNSAISMKFKFLSMFAYMEVFYTRREMNVSFPQIMQSPDAKSSY